MAKGKELMRNTTFSVVHGRRYGLHAWCAYKSSHIGQLTFGPCLLGPLNRLDRTEWASLPSCGCWHAGSVGARCFRQGCTLTAKGRLGWADRSRSQSTSTCCLWSRRSSETAAQRSGSALRPLCSTFTTRVPGASSSMYSSNVGCRIYGSLVGMLDVEST
eukprot:1520250-Pyramimonas_sp.AAC.1